MTTSSPDLVSLVKQLYAAFATRDIPALLSALADDVEWSEPDNPLNPAAGTRRGHAGVLEWLQIGNASEEILALDPRQFLVADASVAVVGHMKCRARPTGKTYESDFVHLVTIRGGKVCCFQEFFDTFAAAEAFRPSAGIISHSS